MKDRWTIICIGGALAMVGLSMVLDGGNPVILFKPAPMILVFGGTFFAAAAGFMKTDMSQVRPIFTRATKADPLNLEDSLGEMVRLAALAKGSGILALDR